MLILSSDECVDWCLGQGYRVKGQAGDWPKRDRGGDAGYRVQLRYPQEASRLYFLAGVVGGRVDAASECLAWVTQSGVWPSSENLHLFGVWRKSHEETRSLFEAPGYLFRQDEREELVTLLHMAVLFAWDVYVLPGPHGDDVFLSHDEFCVLSFASREEQRDFAKQFKELGFVVTLAD